MRYTHEGRTINRVEWFSPSTREWRTEEGARVTIYGLDRYAIVTPTGGTYLRRGGARVMGYLANQALSAEPLRRYLAGRSPRTAIRALNSTSVLPFRRSDVTGQAVLLERISLAEARERGLFAVRASDVSVAATARPAGRRSELPVRAYWFGPTVGGRSAIGALDYSRKLTPEQIALGYSRRVENIVHFLFYELPSAGGRSSLVPGQTPPEGEIQISSQPVDNELSRLALRAFNGDNGGERYDPWPHHAVTLANGEHATAVPNLSEGVQKGPFGREK